MEVNKVLSKQMHVEPLKKGEVAEFRLCGSGKIDPKTGNPKLKSGVSIPGTAMVTDVGTGLPIVIGNVVGYREVKSPEGIKRQEPITDRVRFPKTNVMKLTFEQNGQYMYMMRLNINESNPFAEPGTQKVFFLVNPRNEAKKEIQNEDLELDARILIRNAPVAELQAVAQHLGINVDKTVEEIRRDVIRMAKKHPLRVINASNNQDLKAKAQIMEAAELQMIGFFTKDRSWCWKDGNQIEEIVSVPVETDPYDFLIDFIKSKDGRSFYKNLVTRLKKTNALYSGTTTEVPAPA